MCNQKASEHHGSACTQKRKGNFKREIATLLPESRWIRIGKDYVKREHLQCESN